MGYLFSQMGLYLLIALLLGLLLGWLLWGRSRSVEAAVDPEAGRLREENTRLRRDLDACSSARSDLERQLAERPSAVAPAAVAVDPKPTPPAPLVTTPVKTVAAKPARKPATTKSVAAKAPATKAVAAAKKPAPKAAAAKAPAKPKTVVRPDDLRRIVGIGPVNERLLHGLDVRTFAQIAKWTKADVKRIEAVLEFDGRIERERWIEQAKLLAAGKDAEFLRKFPTAGTDNNT